MKKPLVSILIPAYNRPHYLKIALLSALNQTYPNIEIIICDDSTNHDVYKMIEKDFSKYSNIRYFKNKKNLFIKNWHKCFNLSRGEYINYLMDDDIFAPNKIQQMMDVYLNDNSVSLVTSYRTTIDKDGNLFDAGITKRFTNVTTKFNGIQAGNYMLLKLYNYIGEPTTCLFKKKDLSEKVGVYKGHQYVWHNDVATWLALLSKGDLVYISEPLSSLRIHASQNSQKLKIDYYVIRELFALSLSSKKDGFLADSLMLHDAINSWYRRCRKKISVSENDPKYRNQVLRDKAIFSLFIQKYESNYNTHYLNNPNKVKQIKNIKNRKKKINKLKQIRRNIKLEQSKLNARVDQYKNQMISQELESERYL